MKQYIYGKNPIMEALKGASVYKIYMLNGHKDPKIFDICKRNQIPLEFVDKKEFDKKVGKVVHQGVMAYIENYRYYTIDEILKDIPENKKTAVEVALMAGGYELDTVILNADNNWSASFTGLPEGNYAVREVHLQEDMEATYSNVTLDGSTYKI